MDSILIIGGNGFLGSYLAQYALRFGMRVGTVGTAAESAVPDAAYFRADVADRAAMQAVFQAVAPRFVVHTAAIADIDFAERHPDEAMRVNATGAAICAELAAKHGARHLFFSSDAVFDGELSGYSEEDATNPRNYYGKTKERAERLVAEANPNVLIARVSLLLGRSEKNSGVVDPVRRKLEAGGIVFSNDDQIRSPIDLATLSEAAVELLAQETCSGLLHLACTGSASKVDICRSIASCLGFDPERVQPYPAGSVQGAARHRNGVLRVDKAIRLLRRTRLPSLEETILRAVKET